MLKAIKETSVKIRRKFDQTFKREAVQNWLASGKSAQVIANELGLLPNRLYAWRKRFGPADPGGRGAAGPKPGSVANLQSQLADAQREIQHLRQQRDILKKHWAFSPNRRPTLRTDRRDEKRLPGPGLVRAPGSLRQRLL